MSGRARPRKKPTPSSKSRSPDAIPRSRPAASSAPPSRPRPTASSPPRPSRPTGCANAAAIPALSPDPSPPRNRVRLRRIRGTRFRQQPDRLRLELRRISSALCHDSIISYQVRGNTEQKSVHITRHLPRPVPTHRDNTKWQSDRDLERRNQPTRAIAAKLNIQKPAPIISVAGFLFTQLNTTISRNPYFGANEQILEQNSKTKPAGAKLYQHQQAVSGGAGN